MTVQTLLANVNNRPAGGGGVALGGGGRLSESEDPGREEAAGAAREPQDAEEADGRQEGRGATEGLRVRTSCFMFKFVTLCHLFRNCSKRP